jgi:predicted anti-sigma-YlaC factor YlaD
VVLAAGLAGVFTAFVAFFAGSFFTAIYKMLL